MHRDGFDPSRLVLVCSTRGSRSALAAQTLSQLGYRHAAHLDGGITGWADTGRSLQHADDVGIPSAAPTWSAYPRE